MKSKITGIHPEGATMARANGSAVNVGDDIDDADALTLTIPAGSSGGSVQFAGKRSAGVAERVGAGILLDAPTAAPMPVAIPALVVSDTAKPTRLDAASLPAIREGLKRLDVAVPPVLKVR